MKYIYVLRHGKAEIGGAFQSDRERRLEERGQQETRKTARKFFNNHWSVQQVISSPALRASETAEIFCQVTHYPLKKIVLSESIYDADDRGLLHLLQNLQESCTSVMLVGHNPSFTDLTSLLVPSFNQHIPTGGLVGIRFRGERWDEIRAGQCELLDTIFLKSKKDKTKDHALFDKLKNGIAHGIEQSLFNMSFPVKEEDKMMIDLYCEQLTKKLLKK